MQSIYFSCNFHAETCYQRVLDKCWLIFFEVPCCSNTPLAESGLCLGSCFEDSILSEEVSHNSHLLQQKNMLSLPAQETHTLLETKVLFI